MLNLYQKHCDTNVYVKKTFGILHDIDVNLIDVKVTNDDVDHYDDFIQQNEQNL